MYRLVSMEGQFGEARQISFRYDPYRSTNSPCLSYLNMTSKRGVISTSHTRGIKDLWNWYWQLKSMEIIYLG